MEHWMEMAKWDALPPREENNTAEFRNENHKLQVEIYLKKFHQFYQRADETFKESDLLENKYEYWIQETDRVDLDMVSPRVVYWTSLGRVTRLKIVEPNLIEDFDDLSKWKMIIFRDYHRNYPEITDVSSFIRDNGDWLVNWYANWRKWSYQHRVWHYAADMRMVDLPPVVPEENVVVKTMYLNSPVGRSRSGVKIHFFLDWELFDGQKSKLKRIGYIQTCYVDDVVTVPLLMDEKRMSWYKSRIEDWNNGFLNDDGNIDYEAKKRAFLGECFYRCVKAETDLAFILRRLPDREFGELRKKDPHMDDAQVVD